MDLKIDKIIVIIIFLYNIVNIDKHITYNKLLLKLGYLIITFFFLYLFNVYLLKPKIFKKKSSAPTH